MTDPTAEPTAVTEPSELAESTGADDRDAGPRGVGAPTLAAALEALVLLAVEPVSETVLAQTVDVPVPEVHEALVALAAEYREQGRGFALREVAEGWRFYTADEASEAVERYVREGHSARLSQAALETLAVIAYKQPVTRMRISAIRGVNVDGVIRTLTSRGLIEEAGHEEGSAAILYRTTGYFLERMGLASLTDLPPIGPLLPDVADALEIFDSLSSVD